MRRNWLTRVKAIRKKSETCGLRLKICASLQNNKNVHYKKSANLYTPFTT